MESAGERRFPSCTLASKVIRRCLQSELVLQLVNKNYWATALRLKWRVNNDQVYREEFLYISVHLFENGFFFAIFAKLKIVFIFFFCQLARVTLFLGSCTLNTFLKVFWQAPLLSIKAEFRKHLYKSVVDNLSKSWSHTHAKVKAIPCVT